MALIINILLGYVVVALGFLYIMLMGPSPYHRNGLVGKANRCVHATPETIAYAFCWIRSKGHRGKARSRQRAFMDGMMNRRHPTLVFVYYVLMGGAYYCFFQYVYPALPEAGNSRPLSLGGAIFAIGTYLAASYVNPGRVTPASERHKLPRTQLAREDGWNRRYEGDGILFPVDREQCRTCKVPRPARSKHCRICGMCVRRFDHHCAWLNQDVGEGNTFHFHLFLVTHAALSFYYALLCFLLLATWVEHEGLWRAKFRSARGGVVPPSYSVVFVYTLNHHPAVMGLLLFATIVGFMLTLFWASHFRAAMRNQTTNEHAKLDEYRHVLHHETTKQKNAAATAAVDSNDGPVDIAAMTREFEAATTAYSLGSWWKNVLDAFGFYNLPQPLPTPPPLTHRKASPTTNNNDAPPAASASGTTPTTALPSKNSRQRKHKANKHHA